MEKIKKLLREYEKKKKNIPEWAYTSDLDLIDLQIDIDKRLEKMSKR